MISLPEKALVFISFNKVSFNNTILELLRMSFLLEFKKIQCLSSIKFLTILCQTIICP